MKERLRTYALTLFDAVGFTSVAPPDHTPFVRSWLDAGLHGELGYLEKRHALRSGPLDSENLLAGAQSVIVVAQSYTFPATNGPIARYARGDDYHDILWEKLNTLAAWLAVEYPGTHSRGFTDSGPLRERELATRAGLGWQGKHTNLISLSLGNWFFLGALLTTLAIAPDPPFATQHCGRCTRCLAACPTGALIAPLALNATRCISYLTIELKGPIPEPLRPLMGDRIFGCDDCLAVCPWNAKARLATEARLVAKEPQPDLLALLHLLATDEAFRARFRGTPLLRPGRAGLRRNVCVALGNVGGPEALGPLETVATTDPSELVQEHARWAIAQITASPLPRAARGRG